MKNAFENLESPFLEGELEFAAPSSELSGRLNQAIDVSPFAECVDIREAEDRPEEESDDANVAEEEEDAPQWEFDTPAALNRKLKVLSFLPHFGVINGSEAPMSPGSMNPGIYQDPVKYKIAPDLQKCLNDVMKRKEFRNMKVALVDLTKSTSTPEFAGYFHKEQVGIDRMSSLAALFAAFQLRRDLRVALPKKGSASLDDLFDKIRDDWGATQLDVKVKPEPFSGKITRRRNLVLVSGATVKLGDLKSPQLDRIFGAVPSGDPVVIEFSTTGEDDAALEQVTADFIEGKADGQKKIDDLGFRERLRLMMMRRKPKTAKYAASTIVADLGYLYIASVLLQSGLFDPARAGGLWLASNLAGKKWAEGVAIGGAAHATAGSVAAFLTLLMQDQLVDAAASAEMRALLTEEVSIVHDSSRSRTGLEKLPDEGSIASVLSSDGIVSPGMHDCAVVDRQSAPGKDSIRYIAVGLGSSISADWQSLIVELDKCILANNSLTTPEAEEEAPEEEVEEEAEEDESQPEQLTEEEKGIIGVQDDRTPINDTLKVPFRWICRIWVQSRIKFGAGGHEEKTGLAPLATGVLVTPRHVLTAAHVLHGNKQRGSVTEEHEAFLVEVAPGANGDQTPFGRIEASSWKIAANWKPDSGSSQWDYALITLKEPVGNQNQKALDDQPLCYWGSSTCGAKSSVDGVPSALLKKLMGANLMTAGYPTVSNGGLILATGKFSAGETSAHLTSQNLVEEWVKRTGTFFITADASEGQSGSPVWILNNGWRYMIGILAAIGDDFNTVVNLRDTVIRDLKSWIAKK